MIRREEYELGQQVVLGRAKFNPPFKVNFHLEQEARFVHIVRGKSTLFYPSGQVKLHKGDSIILKCEHIVNHWSSDESDQPCEAIILKLFPDTIDLAYNSQLPDFFKNPKIENARPVERISAHPLMTTFVNNLSYYLDHPKVVNTEMLKLKIRELILLLSTLDDEGRLKNILGQLFHSNHYEFKEVINTHLFEDLKLEELAFLTQMSVSSFKRKFKSIFQVSPGVYIKTKRLEKAENLLRTSDLRITEVAFESGFNDLSHFSKSFAAQFQHSPSEYRNLHVS